MPQPILSVGAYDALQLEALQEVTAYGGVSPVANAMVSGIEVAIETALASGDPNPIGVGLQLGLSMIASAATHVAGQVVGEAIGGIVPVVGGLINVIAGTPAAKSVDQSMASLDAYCAGYDGRIQGSAAQGAIIGADYFLTERKTPGTYSPSKYFKGPWRTPFAQTCWAVFETRLWTVGYPKAPKKVAGFHPSQRRTFRAVRRAISSAWGQQGTDGGAALWLIYADMIAEALEAAENDATKGLRDVEALYVGDGVTAKASEADPEFQLTGWVPVNTPGADGCTTAQQRAALQVLEGGWGAQGDTVVAGVEECGHLGTFSCPVYTRAPLDALYEVARVWRNTINPIYSQDAAFAAQLAKVVKEATGRPLPAKKRPKVRPPAARPNVPYLLAGGAVASGLGYAVATGAAASWYRSARRFLARSF